MLSLLKIRNLALVERLDWELGGGLVGVTGEAGAEEDADVEEAEAAKKKQQEEEV